MFATKTLAGRLLKAMFPWYLLLALSLTAVQLAIQYFSVSSAIATDLASLTRMLAPSVTNAVWELDGEQMKSITHGLRQNEIVTGVRIVDSTGATLERAGSIPKLTPVADDGLLQAVQQWSMPLIFTTRHGRPELIGSLQLFSAREVIWRRIKFSSLTVLLNSVIITTALWLIFSWTMRFHLSAPLARIAAIVDGWRFRPGDAATEPIAYAQRDELGTLIRALNDSRSHLAATLHELTAMNQNLEQMVATRTRELREAKDAAEAASRAKGAFLANMSHEIRTPMNAIMGLTHLVLETRLGDRQRDYLEKVQTSSTALLGLLNDILDYSKIEAGRMELEQAEFPLEKSLRNASNLFIGRIEEKGLELFVEIDPQAPRWLVGDSLRLEQVLNNLLGNAVKFTDNGEILLQVELLQQDGDGVTLQFSVRDSGIGIERETAARLFQAFTQADTSVTRKFGGTGLGLAICKHLVGLMGGEIGVSSEPGKGSTFCFSAHFGIGHPCAGSDDLQQLRGMKALIADDQETSLLLLRRMLESWHFRVTTTTSGAAALQYLFDAEQSGEAFELLLLDWKMPGMSGLDVALAVENATREGRIKSPPILTMVTAHDREQLRHEAGSTRLDLVLAKPVVPSELLDAILHIQQPERARPRSHSDFLAPRVMLTQLRGAHILLVEDNELNQQVASEFLRRAGLRVSLADNGQQALQQVQQQAFDAVLMDLHMPVMDGFEATRRIRQLPQGHELPIIAMTAAAMAQDRIDSAAAGMNAHIAKPVDPQELAQQLLQWIKPGALRDDSDGNAEPPAASATDIAALVAQLPDVSVHQALARLHGDLTLYRRLLARFAEQHRDSAAAIEAQAQPANPDELYRLAHELKGEAGNLGLDLLAKAAQRLAESARLRQPELLPQQAAELATACRHCVAALQQCAALQLQAAGGNGTQQVDQERLLPMLQQLAQQLTNRSFSAMESASAVETLLAGTGQAEAFARINRAAQALSYDAALTALRQWMADNGW